MDLKLLIIGFIIGHLATVISFAIQIYIRKNIGSRSWVTKP